MVGLKPRISTFVRIVKDVLGLLDILGHIDNDRAGTSGAGDIEGLFNDAGEVLNVLDEVVVLAAGARDTDEIDFLEGVIANQCGPTCPEITTIGVESM